MYEVPCKEREIAVGYLNPLVIFFFSEISHVPFTSLHLMGKISHKVTSTCSMYETLLQPCSQALDCAYQNCCKRTELFVCPQASFVL